MPEYEIEIADPDAANLCDPQFLKHVIQRVLEEEQVSSAIISVALVDDAEIHRVNRQFLAHDYPTDVISFLLDDGPSDADEADLEIGEAETETRSSRSPVKINGELVVSTQTAIREASRHGWSPAAELLLYVVHGLLHLCGYDDVADEARPVMRSRERELLALWGFCPTGLEP